MKSVVSLAVAEVSATDDFGKSSRPELAILAIVPPRMAAKLTVAAGPMATLILGDHISILGESERAFSKEPARRTL